MILVAALLACTSSGPTPGTDVDLGTDTDTGAGPGPHPGWTEAAPLLSPLQENGVVALGGEVVVVGGYDDQLRIVARVEAYDPQSDSWRSLADLPEPVHHPNVAVVDGLLYVVGALSTGFSELAVTWIYDPAADAWTEGTPPPDLRAAGASGVGVLDGRIHVVGGLSFNRTVALHSVYDPVQDRWSELPDAPVARDHLAGGVVDGELVLAAGRDGGLSAFVPDTWIYDGTDWREGAPIPTPRGGVAAAVGPDGRLHVLGGEGSSAEPSGVFGDHESYDPATDTWTAHGAMGVPRHGTGAAWIDGVLYVPGGAQIEAFGADDTHEAWTP